MYFHKIEFPKTHDIRTLVNLSIHKDNEFLILQESAEFLTPFATEFRYPDDIFEPDYQEFLDALKVASEIYNFVINKLALEKSNLFYH